MKRGAGLLFAGAAALGVFAVLCSRFPETLFFWDEFQLAYGVLDFDLARHQPHPPGYLLFVWLGRLLLPVAGEPELALRWVAAAGSAGFAALAVGRPPGGLSRAATAGFALAAAVFAVGSPLVGRYGLVGLSYTAEGALWCAWLLAFASRPGGRQLTLLVLAAGLAGGLRPTLALWTAVFLAWAALGRGAWLPRARWIPLAGTFLAGLALWVAPLIWESGGFAAWREASTSLAAGNIWAKSIFARGPDGFFAARLLPMLDDLARGLGLLAAIAAMVAARRFRRGDPCLAHLDPLLAGAALAFLFYALLIYDTAGYLLAVAMPLAVHALRGAAIVTAGLEARRQPAVAGAVLFAAGLVAIAPDGLAPNERFDLHDARLEARFAAVRRETPARATVLVTSQEYRDYGLRHVAHYLPEHPTLQLVRDDFFAIVSDETPWLVSEARTLRAIGPAQLDLGTLVPDTSLAQVIYMLPAGDDGVVTESCARLLRGLDVGNGETLQRIVLQPGWRVIAHRGRLDCRPSAD